MYPINDDKGVYLRVRAICFPRRPIGCFLFSRVPNQPLTFFPGSINIPFNISVRNTPVIHIPAH